MIGRDGGILEDVRLGQRKQRRRTLRCKFGDVIHLKTPVRTNDCKNYDKEGKLRENGGQDVKMTTTNYTSCCKQLLITSPK